MRYEILKTEIEDSKRLIKVKDLVADQLIIYYEGEVQYIPDPELLLFLKARMYWIRSGVYDS